MSASLPLPLRTAIDSEPLRLLPLAVVRLSWRNLARKHLARLAGISVAIALSGFPVTAQSNQTETTPDDVYRIVETVNSELRLFHEFNDIPAPTEPNLAVLTPRRPRHVLQNARKVLLQVQLLRKINGLPEKALPPEPTREVRPADVKEIVDRIAEDISDLRPIFGIKQIAEPISKPSGKSPTDVYGRLRRTSVLVNALGIPEIVPNDVYRVALTILSDLELIRSHRGSTVTAEISAESTGKKPEDVYEVASKLLAELETLTRKPDFAIPGGVVLLTSPAGRIVPEDVMILLNSILAEISAIKVKLGISQSTQIAPAQAGKTPSHVYDAVQFALVAVRALKQSTPAISN